MGMVDSMGSIAGTLTAMISGRTSSILLSIWSLGDVKMSAMRSMPRGIKVAG